MAVEKHQMLNRKSGLFEDFQSRCTEVLLHPQGAKAVAKSIETRSGLGSRTVFKYRYPVCWRSDRSSPKGCVLSSMMETDSLAGKKSVLERDQDE